MARNNLFGKIKRDVSMACGGLALILNSSCVYLGFSFPTSNQVYQNACPSNEPTSQPSQEQSPPEQPQQPTYPDKLEAYFVHEDGSRFASGEKLTVPHFRVRIAVPEEAQRLYGGPVGFQVCAGNSNCGYGDDCLEAVDFSQPTIVPNMLGVYESTGAFRKFSVSYCNSSVIERHYTARTVFNNLPEVTVNAPIDVEL